MIDFSPLQAALSEHLDESPTHIGTRHGNQFWCEVTRGNVRRLADMLRTYFGAELILMVANDRRADRGVFEVCYLFTNHLENWFVHATCPVPADRPWIHSLATFHYPASRFEREIRDLFGIEPVGHPDTRALVRHAFWPDNYFPLLKDAGPAPPFEDEGTPFPFRSVGGEGIYEIPVGPVHAGVIEPGHFRFSVVGETVVDLKIRLYFTHKGTEKLFEGRLPNEGVELAERISGDTTVGHSLAYCQSLESLAGTEIPERARYLRTILLEMERLYNHIGDFGAICNDTGFAAAYSHCLRIRERVLRVNKKLTGSRLLRGGVVPGGVAYEIPSEPGLAVELDSISSDFGEIVEISLNNTMLVDRLEGTGQLTMKAARDHGTVGYVARASGIDVDVRRDHPFAAYDNLKFKVPVFESGDVYARTRVRVAEVRESVGLIKQSLLRMPAGPVAVQLGHLPPFGAAFGMVEGWRGAIIHWCMADQSGRLFRVKVKDPSFANWPPLSLALLNNIVPDFPLCNKSFNQSYSGNDL